MRAVHRLDGTEIIPYGYDYFSTAVVNNAQYILAERDGYEYVFSLLDGSLIYEENTPDPEYDYVQYFMKDCMIIQHREVVVTAENGGWPIYGYYSQLYHYDGTPFGEKYRNIYPLNDVYRTMAAKDANAEMLFHATTQNGVEAVINQAGEVIFEVPDNGWVTVLNEDRIIKNDYDTNIASLCDGQGNSLTEKDYSYMHTMYMEDATGAYIGANLLNASYTIAGKTMYDLLDFDGNVLVERAKNIQTLSPDRFWVEKGFYQGLMDRDGNWLYKQSVFDSAVDE